MQQSHPDIVVSCLDLNDDDSVLSAPLGRLVSFKASIDSSSKSLIIHHALYHPPPLLSLFLRLALFIKISLRSSRSVTHTHSQLTISTNANAKNTRFLSPSPPQPAGT